MGSLINEEGNTYGDLEVIRRSENNDHRNGAVWICRCSCGETASVRGTNLRSGQRTRCGNPSNHADPNAPFRELYRQRKLEAEDRGYDWNLSKSEFKRMTSSNCYYCGREPSSKSKSSNHIYLYNGIDRVDNNKGYIESNCVPCCYECNKVKGSVTLSIARKMVEFDKSS